MLSNVLLKSGLAVSIAGLAIEFIAMAGVSFHSVRARLPFKSPMTLQMLGAMMFFGGVIACFIASAAR